MTLFLLALPLVALYTIIIANVSGMLLKLNGYKDQLLKVIAFAHEHLNELPAMMPKEFQNQTLSALQKFEKYFDATTMVHEAESYISTSLTGFISQTESLAFGMVFFILYTFLWLFVPMHLNSHLEKANTFTVVPWRTSTRGSLVESRARLNRTNSYIDGQEEVLTEVQDHMHKVIWQYFLAMVIINAVYAGSVLALLISLGVDMSGFIAVVSFFLGFIPELGAIITTVLPILLVALEPLSEAYVAKSEVHQVIRASMNASNATHPETHVFVNPFADWSERSIKLIKVFLGMIIIKLAVANVLTSIIMGRNRTLAGDVGSKKRKLAETGKSLHTEVKETHPVIILFAVVISGEIWGAVGMLISVPVISFLRLFANIWFIVSPDEGGSSFGSSIRPPHTDPRPKEGEDAREATFRA
eukprot:UN0327